MRERFETENEFGSGVVKSWASIVDENALDQAKAISRVPIVDEHLALMPDAHFGFGPPVGSALKTRGAVMPYAVGVDIGCGMMAVRTSLERGALAMHEAPHPRKHPGADPLWPRHVASCAASASGGVRG